VPVKTGDIIALKSQKNTGYDWGVYDLRKPNDASKDPVFREKYRDEWSLAYHGVCWLNWLNPQDTAKVHALPGADGKMGKTSDYC